MNRPPDRVSRAKRHRIEEDEQPYTAPIAEETQEEVAPRRRRSQAARIRMEETGAYDDTLVPGILPPQDTTENERVFARPVPRKAARPPIDDDPFYGEDPYDKPYAEKEEFSDSIFGDYDDDDDDKGSSPKRRTTRWVVIILIILALLAGITYVGLSRPDFIEPVVQWGMNLFSGATPEPTLEPTPEPTPEPDPTPTAAPLPDLSQAAVFGLRVEPANQPDIMSPVTIVVNTTMQTSRVRVVDNNGVQLLEMGEGEYEDDTESNVRIWRQMYYFAGAYEGEIEAYPGNESGWNEARGTSFPVKIGDPSASQTPPGGDIGDTGDTGDIGTEGALGTLGTLNNTITTEGGFEPTSVTLEGQAYSVLNPVDDFMRESGIEFGDAQGYLGDGGMNGVMTFRGSGMRQNAAYGTVSPSDEKLTEIWSENVGLTGESTYDYGAQPVIAQWHSDIRKAMPLNEDKLEKSFLREVIFAGSDGALYFYDLEDGSATREPVAVEPTMPMLSTPSLYPRGYPLLVATTGDPTDDFDTMEEDTGLIIYNMVPKDPLRTFGRLSGRYEHSISKDPTFVTSPLIDNETDTIVAIGGNGVLFTMELNINMTQSDMKAEFAPNVQAFRAGSEDEVVNVESSLAAYGEYAYYATIGGTLQCVNLNTMKSEWALEVGAVTRAAIALDDRADGIALYHASMADVEGLAHMRRVNAETGEIVWDLRVPGSITASPLVGTGAMDGTVLFAVANSEEGGTLYAIDASTGEQKWAYEIASSELSSPIALYDGEGKAWVVQPDADGLHLINGLTGESLDYLALDGGIYGAPAAFEDMIVIATADGKVHGVQLQ